MTRGRGALRARRQAALVFCWLAFSVLTGCNYDYLMVSDPVFETVFDVEQMIEAANSSIRRAPALDTQDDWGNRIDSYLSVEGPRLGVVLTPLLFNEAPSLATRHSNLTFLLLSEAEEERPNLLTVRFDRIAAFREAGRTAKRHVEETGALVALFAEAGDNEASQEIEAFEDALSPATINQRFVYSRPPDRETVRQELLSLGEEGYLWAIFLRGNTPFALDLASSQGGSAIAEDLGPGEGYGQFVLGSVERDYVEALRRGIDALQASGGWEPVLDVLAEFVTRQPGAGKGQPSGE